MGSVPAKPTLLTRASTTLRSPTSCSRLAKPYNLHPKPKIDLCSPCSFSNKGLGFRDSAETHCKEISFCITLC